MIVRREVGHSEEAIELYRSARASTYWQYLPYHWQVAAVLSCRVEVLDTSQDCVI